MSVTRNFNLLKNSLRRFIKFSQEAIRSLIYVNYGIDGSFIILPVDTITVNDKEKFNVHVIQDIYSMTV